MLNVFRGVHWEVGIPTYKITDGQLSWTYREYGDGGKLYFLTRQIGHQLLCDFAEVRTDKSLLLFLEQWGIPEFLTSQNGHEYDGPLQVYKVTTLLEAAATLYWMVLMVEWINDQNFLELRRRIQTVQSDDVDFERSNLPTYKCRSSKSAPSLERAKNRQRRGTKRPKTCSG